MADQPTTYEAKSTTATQQSTSVSFHPEYAKTIPGILKIVECSLGILCFICACVQCGWPGQGWVQFVSITAFLSTLIDLVLHFLNLISRFPGPWLLIEFIYYVVFSTFFLIAAIVAAVNGSYCGAVAAAAFFAFGATAVYAVDTFFQFRAWRTGQTEMATRTTTTTTTSMEQGQAQY